MPTKRRRRPQGRRDWPSPTLREYLETGDEFSPQAVARGEVSKWGAALQLHAGVDRAAIWREHREDVLGDWIAQHPGSRPWAWWRFDAPEPRHVVDGAELLLLPKSAPTDWEWVWRQAFGVPALRQARPRGLEGLPAVESQAAYLDRLGLLDAEERAELDEDAFEPEDVDPFILATTKGASDR